jgi:superoxide dismutase, Fe-Mn family
MLVMSTLFLTLAPLASKPEQVPATQYVAKDFSHLLGMSGFTDELLKNHFTLYKGYVQNTNLLLGLFNEYISGKKKDDYAYQALRRRFGWEFDGMRLHELYFENLGGKKPLDTSASLSQMLVRDFGSYDDWKKDFVATGLMRGIGWAILYYDPEAKRLFNTWINEHDLGHLATGSPILVMDVWEHAYMPQFGLDRGQYIQAFFNNIDWSVAHTRLQHARIGRQ